jgi:hypothetical protein
MASVDSAKFSAIFTQVESLHELGMDQQLLRARTRDFQILLAEFSVVWARCNVWLSAKVYSCFSRVGISSLQNRVLFCAALLLVPSPDNLLRCY